MDALCTATALVVSIWNGEHRCGDALGAHVSLDLSASEVGWVPKDQFRFVSKFWVELKDVPVSVYNLSEQ